MSKIKKEQFPYASLKKLGLTSSMIDDLPESIIEALSEGKRSPLFPLQLDAADGSKATYYARIQFIEDKDKKARLVCYMINKACELSNFSEAEQQLLLEGKVIRKDIATKEGSKISSYIQIDDNNQVLSAPSQLVIRNINNLACDNNLRSSEVTRLANGDVVTFIDEEIPLSVGIDLRQPSGIRTSTGDEREWRRQTNSQLSRYNFGLDGCWTMEEDGTMNYIPQSEYTEEMTEAFNKRIESFSHGRK